MERCEASVDWPYIPVYPGSSRLLTVPTLTLQRVLVWMFNYMVTVIKAELSNMLL